MWILHFIPDALIVYVINMSILAGAVIMIAGTFLGFVPFVNKYKSILHLIGVALLVLGVYCKGVFSTDAAMREQVKELQAKVATAEKKVKAANSHIKTKIVTKIVKIHDKANVAHESIRRNKQKINAECKLSDEAIAAYNFSITKTKPEEKK
jgi:hypothetical protein